MRTIQSNRKRVLVLAASAAFVLAGDAWAVRTTWINATGNGLWSDPANWSHGVPTAADEAIIQAVGTITLPTATPALARSVERAFGGSGSISLVGGRLVTERVTNLQPATFTIHSTLGPPGDAMAVHGATVAGAIGDGSGGGSFDLLLINSRLRAATTTRGAVVFFQSFLEESGSIASASGVDWVGSGTVNVSSAALNVDRLPDAAPIRLFGGGINYNATSAGASVAEFSGTLALALGQSTIRLQGPGSGSLVIQSVRLAREQGTVLRFTGDASSRLRFINAPAGPNGPAPTDRAVLAFGTGTILDGATPRAAFLTYDAGADSGNIDDDPGLRPLDWNAEHATTIAAGGNVRVTGQQPIASAAAVRSLNLTNGSLQLSGASLLVNGGGMILQGASGSGVTGTGALTFPDEAVLHAFDAAAEHVIDVPVEAAALTKAGNGRLALRGANAIAGRAYVTEGTLALQAPGALGTASVTLAGGALQAEHALTIQHLNVLGYARSTSIGSYRFGVSGGTLGTAAGATVTVHHADGDGVVQTGGAGTVHVPPGGHSAVDFFVYGGELRADGTFGDLMNRVSVVIFGGTVTGRGRIFGSLAGTDMRGGLLSPGPAIGRIESGIFSFGNPFSTGADHVLRLDLNGTGDGDHDQIRATDAVFLNKLALDVSVGYAAQVGDAFTIIDNLSAFGIFPLPSNLPEGSTFTADGYQFRITYEGGTGNDVVLTVVPEPASASMLLLSLVLMRRRRRTLG